MPKLLLQKFWTQIHLMTVITLSLWGWLFRRPTFFRQPTFLKNRVELKTAYINPSVTLYLSVKEAPQPLRIWSVLCIARILYHESCALITQFSWYISFWGHLNLQQSTLWALIVCFYLTCNALRILIYPGNCNVKCQPLVKLRLAREIMSVGIALQYIFWH